MMTHIRGCFRQLNGNKLLATQQQNKKSNRCAQSVDLSIVFLAKTKGTRKVKAESCSPGQKRPVDSNILLLSPLFFFVCVSYLLSGKQLTAQQPHIKGWLNCQRFVEICWSWILDSCIFQMVFVFFIWLIYFFLASHLWSTNVVRHFSKIKEPERNSSGNYTNFIFSKHNLWRAFYFYFYFCVCIHKVYITTRLAYIYTFVCVNSSYVHGWKVLITIYI